MDSVRLIEDSAPPHWRELQEATARILSECGLNARTDVPIRLARGSVSVDVLAEDLESIPPAVYLCECKLWKANISQDIVHAFRTVVSDSGANAGFLISSSGFQSGTFEAATFSNVRLLTWPQFQDAFVDRWFRAFMAPLLRDAENACVEYTEPINSRIQMKEAALSKSRQEQYHRLRETYAPPIGALMIAWSDFMNGFPPELPLRSRLRPGGASSINLPNDILDAAALRPLMSGVMAFYEQVAREFDQVFGGRA